jgi:Spy/CpxP family protein refolding chaperone
MTNRAMLLSTGLLTALLASGAQAQEPPLDRTGPRWRAPSVESVMSMRERLELSQEQIDALDALRREEVSRRNAERAEVEEMRSRLRAGMIPRSEMMAFMEERRATREDAASNRQEQIDGVLTPEQRSGLDQIRAERRAFERGRRAGRRGAWGQAPRGSRGFDRGWNRSPRRGARFPGGFENGSGAGPGLPDVSGLGSDDSMILEPR